MMDKNAIFLESLNDFILKATLNDVEITKIIDQIKTDIKKEATKGFSDIAIIFDNYKVLIKKNVIPTGKDEYETIRLENNLTTERKLNSIKSLLEQEGFFVKQYYHHEVYKINADHIFFISWKFGYKHNEKYEFSIISETINNIINK